VTWAIRGVIMERESGKWGNDEGEEGKVIGVCVLFEGG
jgi:hypothetical protein